MSQPTTNQPIFTIRGKEPLIAILVEEHGETVTYYFNSYKEADTFTKKRNSIQKAIETAGAWKDIDFNEMLDELDQIRHQSKPTPLFEIDK